MAGFTFHMAGFTFVPMEPVRPDADKEERERMFFAHCEKMQKANPHLLLPYGVKKHWWQFGKVEHPFTKMYPKVDISTVKRGDWLCDGETYYSVYADAVFVFGVWTVETTDDGDCVKLFREGADVWKKTPEWVIKAREISLQRKEKALTSSKTS